MTDDPLVIAGRTFRSRLMVGTGKFPSAKALRDAIGASGSEIVTVALRRVDLDSPDDEGILSAVDREKQLIGIEINPFECIVALTVGLAAKHFEFVSNRHPVHAEQRREFRLGHFAIRCIIGIPCHHTVAEREDGLASGQGKPQCGARLVGLKAVGPETVPSPGWQSFQLLQASKARLGTLCSNAFVSRLPNDGVFGHFFGSTFGATGKLASIHNYCLVSMAGAR